MNTERLQELTIPELLELIHIIIEIIEIKAMEQAS